MVSLADVVAGRVTVQQARDNIVMFKSVGSGLQDIAVSEMCYAKAEQQASASCVPIGIRRNVSKMVRYKKNEAREWARENMRGLANVVIPSYSLDLKRLNEKGIRHDIRKEIEYGFWATLLVSEVAITVDEYRQFVQWSHDEAGGKLVLIHHAMFNTLEENIEAVQIAEKEGCELVLLGYPHNFYATTEAEIWDYTKKFCDATRLGVILFPVPHWGFERVHPAGMSPQLVRRMVKEIPNIVCIKAESGMPTPAGFVQTWKNHSEDVVVTMPGRRRSAAARRHRPDPVHGHEQLRVLRRTHPAHAEDGAGRQVRRDDGPLLEDQSGARRAALGDRELHGRRGHPPSHGVEVPGVAAGLQRRAAAPAHDEDPRRAHAPVARGSEAQRLRHDTGAGQGVLRRPQSQFRESRMTRWLCGVGAALFAGGALAQGAWKPEKPVEIIVTCQPGCGPDIAARNIQKIWQDHRIVTAPSVVVNKAGGGGSVAFAYLQQRPGDAHSIVLSGAGAVVNTIMGRGVGHKEITALAVMSTEYVALAVRADSPLKSGRQLIEVLKKDPQAVPFGGREQPRQRQSPVDRARDESVGHTSGESAYRGVPVGLRQAITALMGGHVQAVPASVGLG